MSVNHKVTNSFVILMCICMLFSSSSAYGDDTVLEYRVKAGYLLNFLKFTKLDHLTDPVSVCIMGSDVVRSSFVPLEKERINKYSLKVIPLDSPEGASYCDVIFISRSANKYSDEILDRVRYESVLTVGDQDFFAEKGGIIGFFKKGENIRFAINIKSLRQSNLTISSSVLKLAKIIE